MKRNFRIEENELLNKKHFPVKALFDSVSDARFIKVIAGLAKGMGFGENYGACVFWDDLDDYDKENTSQYDGAEFGLHNGEEVIIGYKDLLYYLTIVCNKYYEDYPEAEVIIGSLLTEYKLRYELL